MEGGLESGSGHTAEKAPLGENDRPVPETPLHAKHLKDWTRIITGQHELCSTHSSSRPPRPRLSLSPPLPPTFSLPLSPSFYRFLSPSLSLYLACSVSLLHYIFSSFIFGSLSLPWSLFHVSVCFDWRGARKEERGAGFELR